MFAFLVRFVNEVLAIRLTNDRRIVDEDHRRSF